jgi:hypothetical protein
MAQKIKNFWKSDFEVDGKNSSLEYNKTHIFGYRDFFDIAVKWRQISVIFCY